MTNAIAKLMTADSIYSISNSETIYGSASKNPLVSNKYCAVEISDQIKNITITPIIVTILNLN